MRLYIQVRTRVSVCQQTLLAANQQISFEIFLKVWLVMFGLIRSLFCSERFDMYVLGFLLGLYAGLKVLGHRAVLKS